MNRYRVTVICPDGTDGRSVVVDAPDAARARWDAALQRCPLLPNDADMLRAITREQRASTVTERLGGAA